MNIGGYTDAALLSDVRRLIGSQRELTARLVVYLAEIEHRRLHLVAGFSSMFEFCVKELRLGEGEAFRRLVAARLRRRFPVIPALNASGEVHLSALALLRPHLTAENHVELLEAVRGKSKRAVEMFLAARFPRPDEPARIRALSAERVRIEFTASAELRDKLERCLDLSSHANPRRDLAVVIERAVNLLLTKLERDRLGKAERPRARKTADPSALPKSPHVATSDRRFVFERDGSRCTYLSPGGHRCDATAFLELDHIVPRALGGGTEPENLRVRCRAHNRLWAEQAFGRAHIERALHFRRRKSAVTNDGEKDHDLQEELAGQRRPDSPFDAHEQVAFALRSMGFHPAEAESAVGAAEKRPCGEGPRTLEALLREALLEATKAA